METKWIKSEDKLPSDQESKYTKYLIVVLWLDTILDKGETKSYVDVARFNSFHKVWLDDDEMIINDDEETTITHWMPLPEPPTN